MKDFKEIKERFFNLLNFFKLINIIIIIHPPRFSILGEKILRFVKEAPDG